MRISSLVSAEETFAKESEAAISLDVTGSPVIHVVLVSDLVGQHVEAMSVLPSSGVDIVSVGINTLDPARSVGEWSVGARHHDIALSFDVVGVNLLHGHLEVARFVVESEISNIVTVGCNAEVFLPPISVGSEVIVGCRIIEIFFEEVLLKLVVLIKCDLEQPKLIAAVVISSLVGTDGSKHDKLLHGSVVFPGQFRLFDFLGIKPAVLTCAFGRVWGCGIVDAISVEVDSTDCSEAHKSEEGLEFNFISEKMFVN